MRFPRLLERTHSRPGAISRSGRLDLTRSRPGRRLRLRRRITVGTPAGSGTMRPMPALQVSFGAPVHGWLPFAIGTAGARVEAAISHVPHDSLGDLATALRALVEDGLPGAVRFCEEPAELELRFDVTAPGRVRLSVERWPGAARGGAPEEVALVRKAATEDLALAFWRALRRLQVDHFPGGASPHWNRPFPVRDVERLGCALGR